MEHYIGPNGELYHAAKNSGWEKEDHKYIKREWKNGRWQYTYPSNTKPKNSKAKSAISNTAKRVASTAKGAVSTALERDAKQRLENRGKLPLQARAALTKGRNAVTSKKPWVSKEYQEELAYNSKKNDGSVDKTAAKKQTYDTTNKKGPSEYEAEVAYNSQKNVYPDDTKKSAVTSKSESTIKRRAEDVVKIAGNATKSVDEYTRKNYMSLITDAAKGMVKGNSKVADALTSYQTNADKVDMLTKAVDNAAKNPSTSNNASELTKIRSDVMKASRAMRDAAGKLHDALNETAAERILDEHSVYEKERFFERYGSDTSNLYRRMAKYYNDIEKQVRDGTYVDPNTTVKGTDGRRSFSVDGLVRSVQDWFGKPEAEALAKASRDVERSDIEWKLANKELGYYEEQYNGFVELVRRGNTSVTVEELNAAYDRYVDAKDALDMHYAGYMMHRAKYEQALDAYLKTPAGDLEKRYDDFVAPVRDAIDDGADWVEDRLDDLEDWWNSLRR